jgi:hypothetical protein
VLVLAGVLPGPEASALVLPGPYWHLDASPYTIAGTDLGRVSVTLTESSGSPAPESSTERVFVNTVDNGPFVISFPGSGKAGSAPLRGAGVCGTNRIDVGYAAARPLSTAYLEVLCPTVGVKPDVVYPSQLPSRFFPSYQGFSISEGSEPVQILLDGVPQQLTVPPTGGTPYFTAAPSCGPHQLRAAQPIVSGTATADTTITVRCAQIALSPAAVAKSAEPTSTSVTGSTFPPVTPVRLAIDGTAGPAVTTDQSGGFTTALPVAGLDCGVHQVTATATGRIPGTATAQLTVSCQSAALTVDPAVLEPGMLTHATGQGFQPGQQLLLTWQAPDGSALVGETDVTAGPDGSVDAWCMAMQHDLVGARQLVAAASTAPGTVLGAADVVVDTSGMEPTAGSHLVFRR